MQQPTKDTAKRWKLTLGLMVVVFLIGTAASFVIASRRVSRVVDTDYYSQGLHYDQTRSGSKNPGLSWTMSAALSGGELQVRVKDGAGAPVAGGSLSFQPQRGLPAPDASLRLTESEPGLFRAPRPVAEKGELHGTLRFSRGEATASQKLVLFN